MMLRTSWIVFFALLAMVVFALVLRREEPAPLSVRSGTIVILGDSVARGAGDETRGGIAAGLSRYAKVVNYGIDGARTATVLSRFAGFTELRNADTIVISIGGNDLFGDSRARLLSMLAPRLAMRRSVARVSRLVARVRQENRHAAIYLLGLYNPYRTAAIGPWVDVRVDEWDARLIASFAKVPAVTIIRIDDLLDSPAALSPLDRFHPSARGYRAIADRLLGAIKEVHGNDS